MSGDGGDLAGGDVDAADALVGGVGEVEVARGVEGEAVREGQACGDAVAVVAAGAGSGECGDDAGGEVELADAVVVGVGEVEVGAVCGEAVWGVDRGGGGGSVVSGEALCAGACDGGDDAGGVDFADAVVLRVGYVEITGWVESDGGGEI